MYSFKIGQTSLEVAQNIVSHYEEVAQITLIQHEVFVNWRQIHKDNEDKAKWLLESFNHPTPIAEKNLNRDAFLKLTLDDLQHSTPYTVWSLTSKVICKDGSTKHLPMMNFHPEIVDSEPYIIQSLEYLFPKKVGVLVDSGRYLHYYGDFLISPEEWLYFLGEFLMPCILVSQRYIGHRLYDGYSTLRLTNDGTFKPTLPRVVKLLNQT